MEIKVMTYNIHHARGLDNRVSLKRIAEVIKGEDPDLVGINEVDRFNIRSFFLNQPQILARLVDMHCFFGHNLKIWFAKYGNVVLSKMNIPQAENILHPSSGEQRGFIKANIDFWGTKIKFITSHFGLSREERLKQIAKIAETIRMSRRPVILTGDFNCSLEELSPLLEFMKTSGEALTFPANAPRDKIDHILCTHHFDILDSYTVDSVASDHLPLVARLKLKVKG